VINASQRRGLFQTGIGADTTGEEIEALMAITRMGQVGSPNRWGWFSMHWTSVWCTLSEA
jgi:hypothetical protein